MVLIESGYAIAYIHNMKNGFSRVACWSVLLLTGCGTLEQAARHGFESGRYRQRLPSGSADVYLLVMPDSAILYPLQSRKPLQADTARGLPFYHNRSVGATPPTLVKRSLDVDLSAALLKYRFAQPSIPNQLNSQLNINLYAGFRRDYFSFSDHTTPTFSKERRMKHFQFDAGVFAGFGITPVNPSVTNGATTLEYDGIVFQKGFAAFVGIHRLTAGLCLGWDNLLDENRAIWLYQQKPWIGFMIGINLGE